MAMNSTSMPVQPVGETEDRLKREECLSQDDVTHDTSMSGGVECTRDLGVAPSVPKENLAQEHTVNAEVREDERSVETTNDVAENLSEGEDVVGQEMGDTCNDPVIATDDGSVDVSGADANEEEKEGFDEILDADEREKCLKKAFTMPELDSSIRQNLVNNVKDYVGSMGSDITTVLQDPVHQRRVHELFCDVVEHSSASFVSAFSHLGLWSIDEKEEELADALLRIADNLGDAKAQHALGELWCQRGEHKAALGPLKRAALQGHAPACSCLADIHTNGHGGVERDLETAFIYLKTAAEAGHLPAMIALATVMATGKGTSVDLAGSVSWLMKCAEAGDANSQLQIAAILQPSHPHISINWAKKASDQGIGAASHFVGRAYLIGDGIEEDAVKAVEYLGLAADRGIAHAMYMLAGIFLEGKPGVPANPAQAVAFLRSASELGSALAFHSLGLMHIHGAGGLERDETKALQYFLRAAELGDPASQVMVARCYNSGEGGLPEDKTKGFLWALKAAKQDHPEGCFVLGVMYCEGFGIDRNAMAGCLWLEKAVALQANGAKEVLLQLIANQQIQSAYAKYKELQSLIRIKAPSSQLNLYKMLFIKEQ